MSSCLSVPLSSHLSVCPFLFVRLSVQINAPISIIIKARHTKFYVNIPISPTQMKFISNFACHAQRLGKPIVKVFNWICKRRIKDATLSLYHKVRWLEYLALPQISIRSDNKQRSYLQRKLGEGYLSIAFVWLRLQGICYKSCFICVCLCSQSVRVWVCVWSYRFSDNRHDKQQSEQLRAMTHEAPLQQPPHNGTVSETNATLRPPPSLCPFPLS